ncbi:pentapeptide repeat-containing protein [Virgibacillus oceani]|uniref:Oxetanocin A resistance protein n=1 Tax=Virgibacillus oceani TaxID=1479511 RepID=A0A917H876_9BACI|nr:pentapeptide repeat-containing protein [Virgibacillus oceani]GGG71127.1 hypothetical protein GCM10011398_14180 [Virgibacillus oceani]
MSHPSTDKDNIQTQLSADCESCFGLCCVALPYVKSADFAFNKNGGTPCRNLQSDFRCGIHKELRKKGFKGCAVYECFGAGQKVSQVTYGGNDWRNDSALAGEMFDVFPIMQQLHEMLYYLYEALHIDDTNPIQEDLQTAIDKTEDLTGLKPKDILDIDVSEHRAGVNTLLLRASKLVRANIPNKEIKINRKRDLIGAKLHGADLRGANLRGAMLIAADLRKTDMRETDLIGADFRDADLRGANLEGSIFLTQAQVNAAIGDVHTKLPPSLSIPDHWN